MNDLVRDKVDHIKEMIELIHGKKHFGIFASFLFKALFIGENDIIPENIEKNEMYLPFMFQCFNSDEFSPSMKETTDQLTKLSNLTEKEIKLYDDLFQDNIPYLIYLILRHKKNSTTLELNEFFVRLVENSLVVKVDFSYSELENIPHAQIVNDLYQILYDKKINNNFHLQIENGHLNAVSLTNNELLEYINSPDSINTETISKQKNASQTDILNNKKNSKGLDISEIKEEEKESVSPKEYKISNKDQLINYLIENVDKLMKKQEENEKKINDLICDKEKQEKIINELKCDKEKKDNELRIQKANIISLNKKCDNYKKQITQVESVLKLIKLRSVFKVFVNFMYIGLGLKGATKYDSQVVQIINFIEKFSSKKNCDKELVESSLFFMNELIGKVKSGNITAHCLDKKIPILDQIFNYIDKSNKCQHFKNILKDKIIAEDKLKLYIDNLENNFANREKVNEVKAKIDKTIVYFGNLWEKFV